MKFNRIVESILNEDRSGKLEQTLNTILDIIQERFPELYNEILNVQSPEELKGLLKSGKTEPVQESIIDSIKSTMSMPMVIGMLAAWLGIDAAGITFGNIASGSTIGAGLGAGLGATAATSALGLLYSIIQGRKKGFDTPLYKIKPKDPRTLKYVEQMEKIAQGSFGNVEAAEYFYEKVPSSLWKDVLRIFKSRNANSVIPTYIDSKIGSKNV